MLGWSITVYRHPTNSVLATWRSGLGGLDWLDKLIQRGDATQLTFDGYPSRFAVAADVVLPLLAGAPLPEESPLAQGGVWDCTLDEEAIARCPAQEGLRVEAWDQS